MKVLFAWEWGAGVGHLASFLPLAERLVSSGVELTIAAKDLTSVRKFYANPDIAVRQAPTLVVRQTRLWRNPSTFAGISWNLGYDIGHRVQAMVDAWRGLLLDTKPTHVVCDFGIGAALAARS